MKKNYKLGCVATSVLRMRLLNMVAFSKKLRWLAQIKVITLKTQLHAVNARWKRLSQLSFRPVIKKIWPPLPYTNLYKHIHVAGIYIEREWKKW